MVKGRVTLRGVYTYSTCSWPQTFHGIRVALSEQRQSRHKSDPATKVIWHVQPSLAILWPRHVPSGIKPRGVLGWETHLGPRRDSLSAPLRFQHPLRLPHIPQGLINNLRNVRLARSSPRARDLFEGVYHRAMSVFGVQ